MRTIIVLLALTLSAAASAEPRKLTLAEAVGLAMRVDPYVAEAHITEQRTQLAVLRAQLDRFQLKVDGQLQELWDRGNIGGPTAYNCTIFGYTTTATKSACASSMGTLGAAASDSAGQGLSNLTAQFNYYLFSGFRVEANVKKAKLNDTAAIVQIKQQRKDLALSVARAYWQVRHAMILAKVQEAALQRMQDAEQIADARVRAGLAAPIDKNRATQRKLTQVSAVEDLLGQAKAAAAGLAVTLGIPGEVELVDDPPIPDAAPASAEEMVRDAFHRRPEVQNARLQTEMQHQQVRIARSNFFPQLSLSALFQYGNRVFSIASGASSFSSSANPFAGMQGDLNLYANLSMNFFDTFNTYTTTADARYQEKLNMQEERRFQRLVDSDVRNAHANLVRLYAKRAPLIVARDIARDNLTIQESRYKNGDALMTDYLEAQLDLSNAELNLADVTASLQEQWLELQAALGFIVGTDNG
ncbi:MAG TPA: TolC family protein [Polyangia bacterium]|nr:TolC family protein [Polyangia bacterium]